MNDAQQEVALSINTLSIGEIVTINYLNGERENFTIACKICTVPAVPLLANGCG